MVLFKIPLPLTVMQILAIDLGTDMLPALALGTEPPEPETMNRPPRPRNERLLSAKILAKAYLFLGPIEGAAGLVGYFFMYFTHGFNLAGLQNIGTNPSIYVNDALYRQATTMSLASIVMTQIGNGFTCRTNVESVFKIGFFKNRMLLWGILTELTIITALIYVPVLANVFGLHPIEVKYWLLLVSFIPSVFIADEIRKLIIRLVNKRKKLKISVLAET